MSRISSYRIIRSHRRRYPITADCLVFPYSRFMRTHYPLFSDFISIFAVGIQKSPCFLSLIRQKAGMAASRATVPHAKNIACTPRKSARMPKNNGAMVFATLVESELMLYADSYSALSGIHSGRSLLRGILFILTMTKRGYSILGLRTFFLVIIFHHDFIGFYVSCNN